MPLAAFTMPNQAMPMQSIPAQVIPTQAMPSQVMSTQVMPTVPATGIIQPLPTAGVPTVAPAMAGKSVLCLCTFANCSETNVRKNNLTF